VGDIKVVYMDAGFASDDVKTVCEDHVVYYLNNGVLRKDDNTPDDMRENDDLVRIQEQ
jgi:hypothetical protein